MPGFDKWPESLQWLGQLGVIIGVAIAAFFGVRKAQKNPDDLLGVSERDRTVADLVLETKLTKTLKEELSRTREGFYAELRRIDTENREEIRRLATANKGVVDELEKRLREAETEVRVLKELDSRQSESPTPSRRRQT